ncbi:MAG TPA: hypothetical protein VG937_36885 [Polyangiaceae bacterium]|nr:hypothetical protein [Polyangiaceae bacterium]
MIRSGKSSHSIRGVCSVLVLFAPLFTAQAAFAEQACGDTSCPKGFTCEMEPTGCPAIDCIDASCKPCVPSTVSVCRPGSCNTDSDCADGMACAEVQQTNCVGSDTGAVPPDCVDGACPEKPADVTCETTTSKLCQPRWTLSCAADADCGAGFTCKEQQQCSCSGSSGGGTPSSPPSAGSGSSGSADPAMPAPTPSASSTPPDRVPEDCSCEPSGTKACEAARVACAADSDCPSGWSCRDNPEGTCWADSNGNSGCAPADPAKLCFPPYSDLVGGGGRGIATDGAGVPTNPKGDSGSGAPESSAANGNDSGGCSLGGSPPGSGAGLLGLCTALGAALGLARRRARRAAR